MRYFSLLMLLLLFLCSCTAIKNRMKENTLDEVSDMLSGTTGTGTNVFTSDDDPDFIKSALPFTLKVYEQLIQANPDHKGLHQTTAIGYASYAYAFLHAPADTLPTEELDQINHLKKRAKKLYLRSRSYAIKGLDLSYPNFLRNLARKSDSLLPLIKKEDVGLIYWAGMSWFGAFNMDKFDMKLQLSIGNAKKLIFKAQELDPDYGNGAIDNFMITLFGSTPASMGGSLDSAKYYYKEALRKAKVPTADPHISYARAVCVAEKDKETYLSILKKAKKIKPKLDSTNLLLRTLKQQEAQWLIDHVDDFFLPEKEINKNEVLGESVDSLDVLPELDESLLLELEEIK